jgi:hypothetical protein
MLVVKLDGNPFERLSGLVFVPLGRATTLVIRTAEAVRNEGEEGVDGSSP